MQSLWAAGFYYLDPAFMTLLTKTSILWVAAFSLVVFPEERPLARSYRFWLGCLLSLTGVAGVLYFHEGFSATGTLVGIVIALAEAFTWAVYTLSVRIAFRGVDSRCSFSVISLYTTVGLWGCSLFLGKPSLVVGIGWNAWMAVVISAVTSIALAHVLFYVAIQRIGTTLPVLVVLAQPFAVFGLSSLIFHEHLSDIQLLFGAVLLLGSGLSIWAQQHLKAEPAR
jgi:drug/metabolite transporter (DMT)-like permease